MKCKYYVIVADNPFWKQARGPYTFKEAVKMKEESVQENVIITQLVIDEQGKEVK